MEYMYEMEYYSYLVSFLQFLCRPGLPIGSEMTGVVSDMSYAYTHHMKASSVITTVLIESHYFPPGHDGHIT